MKYYGSESSLAKFSALFAAAAAAEMGHNRKQHESDREKRAQIKRQRPMTRREKECLKNLPRAERQRRPVVKVRRKKNRAARTSRQINRRS